MSITNSRSSLKPMSIESVIPSNHLMLCHPLLLLPTIPPRIRVFSNESTLLIRWPKYWSFNFSISPSNEHPGLISFRMDWLDLLAVQGTLKSLLQHHSSEASILQHSAFFMVQLAHPHITTGKTTALTIGTSVSKVIFIVPYHKSFRSKAIPCEKCSTAQTQRMDLETQGAVGRDILITVLQGQLSGGQAQVLQWGFCPLGTQVPPPVPH